MSVASMKNQTRVPQIINSLRQTIRKSQPKSK